MSLSLHRGPFNASPSDRRTSKQALCQSTYLKKDLPQRHFSQTDIFFLHSLSDWEFYHWNPHCVLVFLVEDNNNEGLLVCCSSTLMMCLSNIWSDQEETLVVPHTPWGKSVEVWVIWACWAHYRPLVTDTLKASPDRRGFIKSSAHSNGCCYLCMFVSIRLLSPHFLTQGICPSLSSHEGSFPALCASLALL